MANYISKGTQKKARVIIYSQGRIVVKKALTETKEPAMSKGHLQQKHSSAKYLGAERLGSKNQNLQGGETDI